MAEQVSRVQEVKAPQASIANLLAIPSSSVNRPSAENFAERQQQIRSGFDLFKKTISPAIGPGIFSGIFLNLVCLYLVAETLNIINKDKVKNPLGITSFTKDSATFGGFANFLGDAIGSSWNNFVKKPYYDLIQSFPNVGSGGVQENDFEAMRNHLQEQSKLPAPWEGNDTLQEAICKAQNSISQSHHRNDSTANIGLT